MTLDEYAPVAQLDRAPDFESVGRGFEPLRARSDFSTINWELGRVPFFVSSAAYCRLYAVFWTQTALNFRELLI
jgi:hypothetical protein